MDQGIKLFRLVILNWLIAELWRAERACGAPCVSKSTHPRKFGNHVTVHRTNDRLSAPQGKQCSISHFVASLGAQEDWYCTHIEHQCCDWQLSKQGIRWPVSPDRTAGSGVNPSRSSIFLKLSADKLLVFKVGTSYMIIIMYLNILIISYYILLLLHYKHLQISAYIPIHHHTPHTSPYTPIHHHISLYNTVYPYTTPYAPIHHHTPHTSSYTRIHRHTPLYNTIYSYTSPYTHTHHHTSIYITI